MQASILVIRRPFPITYRKLTAVKQALVAPVRLTLTSHGLAQHYHSADFMIPNHAEEVVDGILSRPGEEETKVESAQSEDMMVVLRATSLFNSSHPWAAM